MMASNRESVEAVGKPGERIRFSQIRTFEHKEWAADLLRLSDLGGAVAVLGKVAEVILVYSGCDPEHEANAGLLDELNNGYITGGINTAMIELGHKVAELADGLRARLDDGEVLR